MPPIHKIPSICWLVLSLVALTWIPYMQVLSPALSFGDEGLVAYSAFRIYQGQVPFRDFFTALTPCSFYFFAILFKLFGPSFLVLRFGVMLISLSLLMATWMVMAKIRVKSCLAYLLPASFASYFGGPVWFIASHHWLAALLCMMSFALLVNDDSEPPSLTTAALAGFLSALAAATLQHRGSLWIVFGSLVFLLIPRAQRLKPFLAYWSGIAVCAVPMAIYFLAVTGWDTIYYDLIAFPLKQYHNFDGHRGVVLNSLVNHWKNCASAWFYITKPLGLIRLQAWYLGYVGLVITCILPFAGLTVLMILWKKNVYSSYCTGCLALFFAASYISTLHRLSDTTLIFAAPAAIIIIALAFERLDMQAVKHSSNAKILMMLLIVLFFSIGVGYATLTALSPKAITMTPAGGIQTLYEDDAKTMESVNAFASNYWKEGEPVFCYPYNAIFYFLFRLENPTPYDTLTWPMHTEQQMNKAQSILQQSANRWVIVNTQLLNSNRSILFERFLKHKYTTRKFCGDVTILGNRL